MMVENRVFGLLSHIESSVVRPLSSAIEHAFCDAQEAQSYWTDVAGRVPENVARQAGKTAAFLVHQIEKAPEYWAARAAHSSQQFYNALGLVPESQFAMSQRHVVFLLNQNKRAMNAIRDLSDKVDSLSRQNIATAETVRKLSTKSEALSGQDSVILEALLEGTARIDALSGEVEALKNRL